MFHTESPPDEALAPPAAQRPPRPARAGGPAEPALPPPRKPAAPAHPLSAPNGSNGLNGQIGMNGMNGLNGATGLGGPVSPLAMRQVLEALGHGLLLLGRRGRVLYANGAAQLACRSGGPLVLQGQQLLAGPADAEAWAQTLEAAERGQWSMQLLRTGEHSLSVGVVPLRTEDATAADEPRVLLVLGSQGLPAGLSLQLFCRQHRLTGAESQVMAALHQGLSPETVAADTGVAISTVRTHIASIRHKTRSPSLRALLQSVAHLPALRGIGG